MLNLNLIIQSDLMENDRVISQNEVHKLIGLKKNEPKILDSKDVEFMNRFKELSKYFYEQFKSENGKEYSLAMDLKNNKELKARIKWLEKNFDSKKIVVKPVGNYIRAFYSSDAKYQENSMFFRIAQLSKGNIKLCRNEENTGFFIWSVMGYMTCNGKTPLCGTYCYNSCRQDDNNLNCKIDNLVMSLIKTGFKQVINKLVGWSDYSKTYVRIHEDGDFYNKAYFEMWKEITEENTDFHFMAYTKEPTLLKRVSEINSTSKNFNLRFSLMNDTDEKTIKFVQKNQIPTYIALGDDNKENDKLVKEHFKRLQVVNRCVDSCKNCKKCYSSNIINLYTPLRK